MVEVLVIFGLLGWLFLTFLEWLSTLPVFPAILVAAVVCPIFSPRD
jgi:predicted ABC-type exoprotein transport system permease subunit